jgi:hypothetical protein
LAIGFWVTLPSTDSHAGGVEKLAVNCLPKSTRSASLLTKQQDRAELIAEAAPLTSQTAERNKRKSSTGTFVASNLSATGTRTQSHTHGHLAETWQVLQNAS